MKAHKIVTEAEKMIKIEINAKNRICEALDTIPDNRNIERIDKRCFSMNISNLTSTIDLTPTTYDYKFLVEIIKSLIRKKYLHMIPGFISEIVTLGRIEYNAEGIKHKYNMTPEFITHLKEIFY